MVDTSSALMRLWKGLCTVVVQEEAQDPDTKRIVFTPVDLHTDQPCRLSFETITTTGENNDAASIVQKAKLFVTSDITIPAGSKLIVTQNGVTGEYEKSGEPAIYSYHQEIMLDAFKGWA